MTAQSELAAAHAERGEFDLAMAVQEENLQLAEELGHSITLLVARLGAAETLVRRAAFHDAIPQLEAATRGAPGRRLARAGRSRERPRWATRAR